MTPEQVFAWDQILVWSLQAGIEDFERLWLFMRDNGVDLDRRTALEVRWRRLIAEGVRFTAGERRPL